MNTKTIDLSSITSKLLREKKYIKIFPEYYALAQVTENGFWHDNQNVLAHVIGVFEGLELIFQFKDLIPKYSKLLKKYLSQPVGNLSRKDILMAATLLHDIAKTDTLIKSADGTTRCPGHELIGASRVKNFSDRFGFNKKDEEHVERIVRYHGLISDFLSLIIAKGNKEKYFNFFQETVGDIDIELVLMMHADLLGSDLEKRDKKTFLTMLDVLSWMLTKLLDLQNKSQKKN